MVKKIIAPSFSGSVYLVHGNVSDRDLLESVCDGISNVTLYGDEGSLDIEGIKIAFCHFPEQARELAETQNYNLVFYGHTHKPWIEKIGKTTLSNPGTLGGIFSKATFSVFDTKTNNLELKILELI